MVTARLRTARLQQTNHDTTEVLEKWLHTIGYLKRMYHRFRLLRRCGMSTEASWRVGWTVTPFSTWWHPKRALSRKPTTLLLKQKSFITIQMPLNMQSHHQMSNIHFIIFSITSPSVFLAYLDTLILFVAIHLYLSDAKAEVIPISVWMPSPVYQKVQYPQGIANKNISRLMFEI